MLLNNKFERNVLSVEILMMSFNTEKCSKDDRPMFFANFTNNWQLFAVATNFCNA